MARYIGRTTSPRHGLVYHEIPTIRGSMYGGGDIAPLDWKDYGDALDCVLNMADQVAASNGVPLAQAVDQVLRDENWRLLPKHKAMIINRLAT